LAELSKFIFIYRKEESGSTNSPCCILEEEGDIAGMLLLNDRIVLLFVDKLLIAQF